MSATLLAGANAPFAPGAGEIDVLTGQAGADIFVLGAPGARLYDDGNAADNGLASYALIADFTMDPVNPLFSDKLRLAGTSAEYGMGASPVAGVAGTALFHDSNASGSIESATDELIAIIRGTGATNALSSASYV